MSHDIRVDCKTVRIFAKESGWTWPEKDLDRAWKLRVGLGRDACAPLTSRVSISRKERLFCSLIYERRSRESSSRAARARDEETVQFWILVFQFNIPFTGFNLEETQSLVGYIQVTGLKFYRDLCPAEKRDEWFVKWKSNYIVHTWIFHDRFF